MYPVKLLDTVVLHLLEAFDGRTNTRLYITRLQKSKKFQKYMSTIVYVLYYHLWPHGKVLGCHITSVNQAILHVVVILVHYRSIMGLLEIQFRLLFGDWLSQLYHNSYFYILF